MAADLNRKFGALLALVFAVLAFYPADAGTVPARPWCLAAALAFGAAALFLPRMLAPLTRAWMGLGRLLHRIVNPVILGVLFFCLLTPIALVRRWRGAPSLSLGFDARMQSYWKTRTPPGPDPETLSRQY